MLTRGFFIWQCNICKKRFPSRKAVREHLKTQHRVRKDIAPSYKRLCIDPRSGAVLEIYQQTKESEHR